MKNSLNLIEKIVSEREGHCFTYDGLDSFTTMNKKASYDNLQSAITYFQGKLPLEYVNFLKIFDGGTIFKFNDIDGFKLFSADEIVKENKSIKETLEEFHDENLIFFCTILGGDAEYLGFRVKDDSKYDVIFCALDEINNGCLVFEDSFEKLIINLIEKRGRYYWFD